jgi:putative membrane protein
MSLNDLPALNATLNGLAGFFLAAGYVFIRRKNQTAHRNCMIAAVGASALFLVGYLTYHFTVHGVTRFRDPVWFRPIYLTLFLTHTTLAVAIVPMIIVTLAFRFEKVVNLRKKLALSVAMLAGLLLVIGLATGFIFGAPRSSPPHLNAADVASGASIGLSILLGFLSLLIFLFGSHKKIARWTWPLWMYVSVTGVIIYLLLYQIFPQSKP